MGLGPWQPPFFGVSFEFLTLGCVCHSLDVNPPHPHPSSRSDGKIPGTTDQHGHTKIIVKSHLYGGSRVISDALVGQRGQFDWL